MNDMPADTNPRGSRALWLAAAQNALVTGGVDAVKIQPLASQLGLSRTSFYWFFRDRAMLLDALLGEWQARNTGAFVTACNAYAPTLSEAVLNLIVVFQDAALFDPKLDFAIRGWAHQSAAVMAHMERADDTRLDTIRAMFTRHGVPPDQADVRARTVYLTQIGYIAMQVDEPLALRMARVPAYVQIFCGQTPTPEALARFHSRMAQAST